MDFPVRSIVLFDGATLPVGWYDCDGTAHNNITTPNLLGKFPKGVPSGGTLGATGTGIHTHTNVNTGEASHGHAGKNVTTSQPSGDISTWAWAGYNQYVSASHNHTVSISAVASGSPHSHTMPNAEPATSLPPNIRLRYIMRCE